MSTLKIPAFLASRGLKRRFRPSTGSDQLQELGKNHYTSINTKSVAGKQLQAKVQKRL